VRQSRHGGWPFGGLQRSSGNPVMNFTKRFAVKPSSDVDLAAIDPSFHGKWKSEEDAKPELKRNLSRITALQRRLYADRRHSLLVVLQGIDGAGKDGTCWHVIGAMDPEGANVQSFKQPTAEELNHDFLWRVHPHAPARGRVAVFNRSHYEDVLVARVHKLVAKDIWKQRYDIINEWEKLLSVENNTTILKFLLHISKDEQLARFRQRLDDPDRQWKISDSDYSDRELWDDYMRAFEAVLSRCSTKHAPWYVIPANNKWFRNLAVSAIIADAMDHMDLKVPKPTVDLQKIRKLYHADATKQDRGKTARALPD
jgi:PPK2 family polyphosphate:nucleotide phosphotransferase